MFFCFQSENLRTRLLTDFRREHIVLQDDPNFALEDIFGPRRSGFAFELDLPAHGYNMPLPGAGRASLLSSHSLSDEIKIPIPAQDDTSIHGLVIPPSASTPSVQPFGSNLGGGSSVSRDRMTSRFAGSDMFRLDEGENRMLEDPGFGFDADGNYFEVEQLDQRSAPLVSASEARERSVAVPQRGVGDAVSVIHGG